MINHLMVIIRAFHFQIEIIIVSLLKVVLTPSLTRRIKSSQLLNWKYGLSKKLNNEDSQEHRKVQIIVHIYLN